MVTAGNASQQNDAAAACLVVAEERLVAARTFMALCMGGTYQLLMLGRRQTAGFEDIAQDVAQALDVFLRACARDGPLPCAELENERR